MVSDRKTHGFCKAGSRKRFRLVFYIGCVTRQVYRSATARTSAPPRYASSAPGHRRRSRKTVRMPSPRHPRGRRRRRRLGRLARQAREEQAQGHGTRCGQRDRLDGRARRERPNHQACRLGRFEKAVRTGAARVGRQERARPRPVLPPSERRSFHLVATVKFFPATAKFFPVAASHRGCFAGAAAGSSRPAPPPYTNLPFGKLQRKWGCPA